MFELFLNDTLLSSMAQPSRTHCKNCHVSGSALICRIQRRAYRVSLPSSRPDRGRSRVQRGFGLYR